MSLSTATGQNGQPMPLPFKVVGAAPIREFFLFANFHRSVLLLRYRDQAFQLCRCLINRSVRSGRRNSESGKTVYRSFRQYSSRSHFKALLAYGSAPFGSCPSYKLRPAQKSRPFRVVPDSVCDPYTILLHGVLSNFRSRAMRQLEIIAPRHQLDVLRRSNEASR